MEQALPDTISLNLADIEQTISFRTRAEPILDLKIFDALAKAVAQRQQLELHYRKPGQRKTEPRLVDPYHLANINGEWFLFAFDHARKDIRTFVPARIQSVKPTGKTFERPQKFSLEKRLRDSFGVHSGEGEYEVVIRFNAARRRLRPRKEMARVAAVARTEGRGSGIEIEAFQPRRNRALDFELGRRRKSSEAARTGRGRQKIGCGDIEIHWRFKLVVTSLSFLKTFQKFVPVTSHNFQTVFDHFRKDEFKFVTFIKLFVFARFRLVRIKNI